MIKLISRYFRFSTQKTNENFYQILRVSPNASSEQIYKAYSELILQQMQGSSIQMEVQKQIKMKEAYEVLSNPEKRKIYDEEINVLSQRTDTLTQNEVKVERPNDSLFVQIFIAFMTGGLVLVWVAYDQENKKEELAKDSLKQPKAESQLTQQYKL